jgi:hypothetical protein
MTTERIKNYTTEQITTTKEGQKCSFSGTNKGSKGTKV